MTTIIERIQLRRGTSAEWTASNPLLGYGEIGVELTTTGNIKFKVGNGSLTWSGLPYFANLTDLNLSQYVTTTQAAVILTAYVQNAQKGVANGVATLDANGKIPNSQLPGLSITETFVVNSQENMLALSAEVGDIAIRTDLSKTFILTATPATTLSNWQEILTPPNAVTSVNGETGAVTLSLNDISDVAIQSGVQTGHYLKYDAGTQTWVSSALPTVDTSNFVTLDGEQTVTSKKIFDATGTSNGIEVANSSITFTGTGSLILPGNNTPSQTVDGSIVWDIDSDLLTIGTGAGRKTFVDLDSVQTLLSKTLTAPTLNNSIVRAVREPVNVIASTPTNLTAIVSETPINLFSTASTAATICAVTLNYSTASANFTDANLPIGSSMTATVILNNTGSFASYINLVTAAGLTTTTRWINATTPVSGNVGSYDVYNFVLIKTGSTTGLILASQTRF